jgi:hypothetical protein
MSSDDSTEPNADFEQLLRGRLRELADHAPTAVPPMGGLTPPAPGSGIRAGRSWRSPWLAVVAGTALAGAGASVFLVSGRDGRPPVDTVIPVDSVDPGSSIAPSTEPPLTTVPATSQPSPTTTTTPSSSTPAPTLPTTTRPVSTTVPSSLPPPSPPPTSPPLTSPPPTSPPPTGSVPPVPTVVPPSP